MIEVAIVALKSALPEEFEEEDVFAGIDQPVPADGETESEAPAEENPAAGADGKEVGV